MGRNLSTVLCAALFLAMTLLIPQVSIAQGASLSVPDKALCTKMIRFGKEDFSRGRYLDAKEYFRKAIQADPGSSIAWRYYDQAVIFALAEKVKRDADLTSPGTSAPQQMGQGSATPPPPPPPKAAAPKKKGGFVIENDEGC